MGGDWLTFVVMCVYAQVTHLNSKAIINKDRLLHHHLCINTTSTKRRKRRRRRRRRQVH